MAFTQYDRNTKEVAIPQFSQRTDKNPLVNLLSPIYTDIKDIRAILDAAWSVVRTVDDLIILTLNNAFIQTCDVETLRKFEKICNIVSNENLSLELRRSQVLQVFAAVLPYTEPKLKELLNAVCGVGNWRLTKNINGYEMHVDVFESFTDIIETLQATFVTYIPAHIQWLITKNITTNLEGSTYFGGWLVKEINLELRDNLPDNYWNLELTN